METPYSSLTVKDCSTTNSSFAVRKLYELNIQKLSKLVSFFSCFMASYCAIAFFGVLLFSEARLFGWLLELSILLAGILIGIEGVLANPREDSIRSLLKQMVAFFVVYLSILLLFSLMDWPDDETTWTQLNSLTDSISPIVLHFAATLLLGLFGVSKTHRLHKCLLELESLKLATYRDMTFSHSR
mmetsp:Transcript_18255/g.32778  ORF Transcript_18255/g.32778 Transcript_18255/m.32778 type:complete len:185 (+) Transcript_18255:6339-6893(+)